MKIKNMMFLAVAFAVVAAFGETAMEKALKPWVESGELPGAISVLYNNGVEEVTCVGYADVATKRPITVNDA